jgi:hypothetical protein
MRHLVLRASVGMLLLTATLSVAILQNILANRDPKLAIVYRTPSIL